MCRLGIQAPKNSRPPHHLAKNQQERQEGRRKNGRRSTNKPSRDLGEWERRHRAWGSGSGGADLGGTSIGAETGGERHTKTRSGATLTTIMGRIYVVANGLGHFLYISYPFLGVLGWLNALPP
jgi:hypothetical protein